MRFVCNFCALMAASFVSIGVNAEPTNPGNGFLNIVSPHCKQDKGNTPDTYLNLEGLMGPVKALSVTDENGTEWYYKLGSSGNIAAVQTKSKGASELSEEIYEYDNDGRLKSIQRSSEFLGNSQELYNYPNADTVVSRSSWLVKGETENRWKVEMSSRYRSGSGEEVCVYGIAIKYSGLFNLTQTIKKNDGSYQYLHLKFEKSPVQITNQTQGYGMLATAIRDVSSSNPTDESCKNAATCSIVVSSRDGELIKNVHRSLNWSSREIETDAVSWSDVSGNELDGTRRYDKTLSNGKWPHHYYKYKFDGRGNWLVRTPLVDVDTPDGIRVKENGVTVVRTIEYFN